MPEVPTFTSEENITRIQMEKGVSFVVVEGKFDTPVYESVINSVLPLNNREVRDVVHVGGKTNIKNLIEEYGGENFICIADKDFDQPICSNRVVNLSRYSIENFFICEEAISAALAISLKTNIGHVLDAFNLDDFFDEVEGKGKKLLCALFFYHKEIATDYGSEKVEWGSASIHKNNPEWGICDRKVDELIERLLSEQVSLDEAEEYYEQYFVGKDKVAYDLPGKMLKVLLQQYVNRFYREQKRKGGNQFKNTNGFIETIIGCLNHSTAFRDEIGPVIKFLEDGHAV